MRLLRRATTKISRATKAHRVIGSATPRPATSCIDVPVVAAAVSGAEEVRLQFSTHAGITVLLTALERVAVRIVGLGDSVAVADAEEDIEPLAEQLLLGTAICDWLRLTVGLGVRDELGRCDCVIELELLIRTLATVLTVWLKEIDTACDNEEDADIVRVNI